MRIDCLQLSQVAAALFVTTATCGCCDAVRQHSNGPRTSLTAPRVPEDHEATDCSNDDVRPEEASPETCSRSHFLCDREGRCHFVGGRCVALTAEDCAKPCSDYGMCHLISGSCVAMTQADCDNAGVCQDHGACSPLLGRCVHSVLQGCDKRRGTFQIEPCSEKGACTEVDGMCVAQSDQTCARSKACRWIGACRADAGQCRALTDADCSESVTCKRQRKCVAVEGYCKKSRFD